MRQRHCTADLGLVVLGVAFDVVDHVERFEGTFGLRRFVRELARNADLEAFGQRQLRIRDRDPRAAIEAALPADTAQDLYRILLTGETGEGGVHTDALKAALADRFYALELRDRTRLAEDLWAKAEEDSLRGLFLRDLKQQLAQAQTEEDRQRVTMAARFGLAALDHRDLG